MITRYTIRSGIDRLNVAVDHEVVKSFLRANAHRYAVAKSTRVIQKDTNLFSKYNLVPKSKLQAVDWAKVKGNNAAFYCEYFGQISRAMMKGKQGDPEGLTGVIDSMYAAYMARFKEAARVRETAIALNRHNADVTRQLEVMHRDAQRYRDWYYIAVSVLAVPGTTGFAVLATASTLGNAISKYQDTGGNVLATGTNVTGSLVNLGLSALPASKLVIGASCAADGLFEGLEALAEGKTTEDAVKSALIKGGAGAGAAGGAALAKKAFSKMVKDSGLRDKLSDVAEAELNFAAGVAAKELTRDPLSAQTRGTARLPKPVDRQLFRDYVRDAIWTESTTREGASDAARGPQRVGAQGPRISETI